MTIDLFSLFACDDFAGTNCIVAAVSGGSDSLAMLFLLRDYLARTGHGQKLVAVTVDHGLRTGSAQEARQVAQLCVRYGIVHETLVWRGEKPKSAVSCHARLARYDLLCHAAEKFGAGVIVTGHTLDDQAETYIMRSLRGSGRGLAAMPRLAVLQQKFHLLRPLLGIRRQALRHYLAGLGVAWIDDPGNDDLHSERVRLRKCLDNATVLNAQCAVMAAARKRQAEAEAVAALALKLHMRLRGERLWFDLASLGCDDGPAFAVLVAIGAAIMGGTQYPATGSCQLLKFVMEKDAALRRMTLSGAVIEITGKFLRIWREKRHLESSVLMPGQTMVWDGRYRVGNDGREVVVLRPPTRLELRQAVSSMPPGMEEARQNLHFPSLEATCMICGGNGFDLPVLTACMFRNKAVRFQRIMLPFDWLVSGYDLALFRAFQPVFTMETGKTVKTVENSHDLGGVTLATVKSEHMLHENLSGAFVSVTQVELI